MKNSPILLVCEEMLSSIDEQIAEIDKYKSPMPANFLFVYALFEGLLRELSFQIYYAFPIKLKGLCQESANPNEYFEIEKDRFLATNDYYFILNSIIDRKLSKLTKDSLANLLAFFAKHSGVSITTDEKLLLNMTTARNIIAHSNGYKIKPWSIDSFMYSHILEQSTLQQYIDYILDMCALLKDEIRKKYQKYTYEKLLLESWRYTCPSILSIYDVFDFSTGKAAIKIESAINKISNISGGEKYLVSMWIGNYSLDVMYNIMSKVGAICSPAHVTFTNEIGYLQQLFREYPYLVNGQSFLVENGKIKE